MKTIAIMNNKGGVGKSVTTIALADILTREHGKRVLLIDCDGQANLTDFYLPGKDLDFLATTATLLRGDAEPLWSESVEELGGGLSLVPGSDELYELDFSAIQRGSRSHSILADFISAVALDDGADYCILDCPPGYTVASVNALYACDEVVIPMLVDGFSFRAIVAMRNQMLRLERARQTARIAGVLITQWHNSDVVRQGESLLRGMGVPVFAQTIRRTDKVAESTFEGQSVALYSPTSAAARDYRAWVEEYLGEELGHGEV